VWNTAKWRTAIQAVLAQQEPAQTADLEGSAGAVSVARTIAAIAVVLGAVSLAVLPVVMGLGLAPGEVVRALAGAGSLAAVVGGVKLGVVAWGLVRRAVDRPEFQAALASLV
jgi:hypothetical protein